MNRTDQVVIGSLQQQISQLQEQISLLNQAIGTVKPSESSQQNLLSVTPTGQVQASFSGLVNALGLILPAGGVGTIGPANEIIWERQTDGAVLATLSAYDNGFSGAVMESISTAVTPETLSQNIFRATSPSGHVAGINLQSGTTAGSGQVTAIAQDDVNLTIQGGILIDSNADSDWAFRADKQIETGISGTGTWLNYTFTQCGAYYVFIRLVGANISEGYTYLILMPEPIIQAEIVGYGAWIYNPQPQGYTVVSLSNAIAPGFGNTGRPVFTGAPAVLTVGTNALPVSSTIYMTIMRIGGIGGQG